MFNPPGNHRESAPKQTISQAILGFSFSTKPAGEIDEPMAIRRRRTVFERYKFGDIARR